MGLHIYSGSLVRYFTNNWENEIQKLAREQGIEYEVHYSDGEPNWPTTEAAAEYVAWLRSTLLAAPEVTTESVQWRDDVDPYYTVKLHEEAREAIMIVSAHLQRPELTMPTQMPTAVEDDIAYAEAGSKGYLLESIAPFEASLIIPGTFPRISFMEDPLGYKRLTCSSARVRAALNATRQRFWNGAVEPAAWLERGLVYAYNSSSSQQVDGRWIEQREQEPADSLKGNAEFAFAVFSSMLEFSDRYHSAIVTTW